MNILPKKRWHVRTKENIARVRRDEAKAAEEERIKQERIKLAESEAKLKLLKNLAEEKYGNNIEKIQNEVEEVQEKVISIQEETGHINFFSNIEEGNIDYKKVNTAHEKEKKEEQEKYEKKIGYLTYLGQDTNEALGKKSWYNVVPDRSSQKEEINIKTKLINDPLLVMKRYLEPRKDETKSKPSGKEFVPESKTVNNNTSVKHTELNNKKRKRSSSSSDDEKIRKKSKRKKSKHKHKKHRKRSKKSKYNISEKYSNTSSENDDEEKQKQKSQIEWLRLERLKREREERAKAEKLLAKLRGDPDPEPVQEPIHTVKQKYNSQFNPELAKQNYDYPERK